MKIVVACGGTGGHVFPGLATARAMRARGHEVTVWLSGRAVEEATLSAWDGAVWRTGARQLRPSPAALLALLGSVWRCRREMRRLRPDRLLAMGSYASLPPAVAARWCGVPLVLHEANAVPGKATERLGRWARAIAVSFPGTEVALPGRRVVLTGLPVRRELASGVRPQSGGERTFTVFVTGGSQGAHAVNELCCAAFCAMAGAMPELRVIHQSGAADAASLAERYAKSGVKASVSAFIKEMAAAYAAADVVICRAGAATCAEICLCGVPAILVPLPSAVRDHQRLNARHLAATGGAIMVEQAQTTPAQLADELRTLATTPQRLSQMAASLRRLAAPDADTKLAELVET